MNLGIQRSISLAMITASLYIAAASAQTGQITGVHDPVMIQCNGQYYIFHTGDGIDIRQSPDINVWKRQGSVFEEIPEWGVQEVPGVRNIWAPDIFFHNDTYYLFYSLSTFGSNRSRIGLAVNTTLDREDPAYGWVDQGEVIESDPGDNYNAIDPNIVEDGSGRIWMSFGSFWSGIKITELNPETMKPLNNNSVTSIAARPGNTAIEAPFIIYRHGYYYLFVSFDACCQGINSTYNLRVGRSKNVIGIYRDKNSDSMLGGGGTQILKGNDRWKGPGHCAIFSENGIDWLVYHAYDAENNGVPTLRINRLDWDEDNWPAVNDTIEASIDISPNGKELFALHQNFPNPFNMETVIRYLIEVPGHTQIRIYSLLGEEISCLVDEEKSEGTYSVHFNPERHILTSLASGLYIYRLETENQMQIRKMLYLK